MNPSRVWFIQNPAASSTRPASATHSYVVHAPSIYES